MSRRISGMDSGRYCSTPTPGIMVPPPTQQPPGSASPQVHGGHHPPHHHGGMGVPPTGYPMSPSPHPTQSYYPHSHGYHSSQQLAHQIPPPPSSPRPHVNQQYMSHHHSQYYQPYYASPQSPVPNNHMTIGQQYKHMEQNGPHQYGSNHRVTTHPHHHHHAQQQAQSQQAQPASSSYYYSRPHSPTYPPPPPSPSPTPYTNPYHYSHSQQNTAPIQPPPSPHPARHDMNLSAPQSPLPLVHGGHYGINKTHDQYPQNNEATRDYNSFQGYTNTKTFESNSQVVVTGNSNSGSIYEPVPLVLSEERRNVDFDNSNSNDTQSIFSDQTKDKDFSSVQCSESSAMASDKESELPVEESEPEEKNPVCFDEVSLQVNGMEDIGEDACSESFIPPSAELSPSLEDATNNTPEQPEINDAKEIFEPMEYDNQDEPESTESEKNMKKTGRGRERKSAPNGPPSVKPETEEIITVRKRRGRSTGGVDEMVETKNGINTAMAKPRKGKEPHPRFSKLGKRIGRPPKNLAAHAAALSTQNQLSSSGPSPAPDQPENPLINVKAKKPGRKGRRSKKEIELQAEQERLTALGDHSAQEDTSLLPNSSYEAASLEAPLLVSINAPTKLNKNAEKGRPKSGENETKQSAKLIYDSMDAVPQRIPKKKGRPSKVDIANGIAPTPKPKKTKLSAEEKRIMKEKQKEEFLRRKAALESEVGFIGHAGIENIPKIETSQEMISPHRRKGLSESSETQSSSLEGGKPMKRGKTGVKRRSSKSPVKADKSEDLTSSFQQSADAVLDLSGRSNSVLDLSVSSIVQDHKGESKPAGRRKSTSGRGRKKSIISYGSKHESSLSEAAQATAPKRGSQRGRKSKIQRSTEAVNPVISNSSPNSSIDQNFLVKENPPQKRKYTKRKNSKINMESITIPETVISRPHDNLTDISQMCVETTKLKGKPMKTERNKTEIMKNRKIKAQMELKKRREALEQEIHTGVTAADEAGMVIGMKRRGSSPRSAMSERILRSTPSRDQSHPEAASVKSPLSSPKRVKGAKERKRSIEEKYIPQDKISENSVYMSVPSPEMISNVCNSESEKSIVSIRNNMAMVPASPRRRKSKSIEKPAQVVTESLNSFPAYPLVKKSESLTISTADGNADPAMKNLSNSMNHFSPDVRRQDSCEDNKSDVKKKKSGGPGRKKKQQIQTDLQKRKELLEKEVAETLVQMKDVANICSPTSNQDVYKPLPDPAQSSSSESMFQVPGSAPKPRQRGPRKRKSIDDKNPESVKRPKVSKATKSKRLPGSPSLRVIKGKVKFYRDGKEEKPDPDPRGREKPSLDFDNEVPWLCVFCGLAANAYKLGDLFGPYYVTNRNNMGKNGAIKGKKKETWFHHDCLLWTPGAVLIGSSIRGLDDAVNDSSKISCVACKLKGASIACFKRGCREIVHYPCAKMHNWDLDFESLDTYCPLHCSSKSS